MGVRRKTIHYDPSYCIPLLTAAVAAGAVGDIEAANGGLRCGFAGHAETDADCGGQADASVARGSRDIRQAKANCSKAIVALVHSLVAWRD